MLLAAVPPVDGPGALQPAGRLRPRPSPLAGPGLPRRLSRPAGILLPAAWLLAGGTGTGLELLVLFALEQNE
jgi:hypothetical protein